MNDLERIKAKASEVKLSLEAVSLLGKKPKQSYRSLQEALAEWADKPVTVSKELLESLKPKEELGQ